MKTLILPPKYSEESIRMRNAALNAGWDVERLTSWNIPAHLHGRELVVYAQPLFVSRIEDELGIRFPEPPDDWLTLLGPDLLKREIKAMPLKEARNLQGRWFIKPANYKTFRAGIFESGADLPNEDEASGEYLTLVSEVVEWESEFRFFMLRGVAEAGSVYYRNGATAEVEGEWPATAAEFEAAQKTAERAYRESAEHLPPAVVIDTGFIKNRGWAVIEANPAWGSGLYGADENRVLKVIGEGLGTRD